MSIPPDAQMRVTDMRAAGGVCTGLSFVSVPHSVSNWGFVTPSQRKHDQRIRALSLSYATERKSGTPFSVRPKVATGVGCSRRA